MIVLVVDDSLAIIERWKSLLAETKSIKAVHGASCLTDASRLLKEVRPGLILLEGNLFYNGTISMLKEIKMSGLAATVIVLADFQDEHILREWKSIGANFFFDKYHEFEKVAEMISDMAADENRKQRRVGLMQNYSKLP
jgi:DNA-binding NarL/FixJ family response regulator